MMSRTVKAELTHRTHPQPNPYIGSLLSETDLLPTVKKAGGFDIAELTREIAGNPNGYKGSLKNETDLKRGLFLLSIADLNSLPKKTRRKPKEKRTQNRKKITLDEAFTYKNKTYRVNAEKYGLYVPIIKRIIEQFEIAQEKWKRVFVLRFDLHLDNYRPDNSIITGFRKRLFQKLKREYGFKEIGFAWCREQERAKSQHYHFVLFLEGRLINRSSRINAMVKQAWERLEGGYHVPIIKHPYHFADTEEITQEAIYRVSYLAKVRGKGYRPPQTKDFQCSRMKPINNNHISS